MQKRWSAVLQ